MIEVIKADACVACDVCIAVCPTDVFDKGPDGLPVIARQSDCQTCFMCEAYCPTDALYVAPLSVPVEPGSPHADVGTLTRTGLFGGYRELVGWGQSRTPGARLDQNATLREVPALPEPRLPVPAALADRPWNHPD